MVVSRRVPADTVDFKQLSHHTVLVTAGKLPTM
jgi:hypothetical protein